MELSDIQLFGRKVFFLNPAFNIEKVVIKELREREYDIYIIRDYKFAKDILRTFPDSICFIGVDSQLSIDSWLNFIRSCAIDKKLETIFFGVMAEHIRRADRDNFILHAGLAAGIIEPGAKLDDVSETISGILRLNDAKGQRQYVRLKCPGNQNCYIEFTQNSVQYILPILDISSVGMACALPLKYGTPFSPNSIFRNIKVTLFHHTFTCSSAFLTAKQSETYTTIILLFLKGTSYTIKSHIWNFIAEVHENELDTIISRSTPDTTDYEKIRFKTDSEAAFLFTAETDEKNTEKQISTFRDNIKMTDLY